MFLSLIFFPFKKYLGPFHASTETHSILRSLWNSLPLCVPNMYAIYLTITWDYRSLKWSYNDHSTQYCHPLDPVCRIARTFDMLTNTQNSTQLCSLAASQHTPLFDNSCSNVSPLSDTIISHTERLKSYRLVPTLLISTLPLGCNYHYSYAAEEDGGMKNHIFLFHNHRLNLEWKAKSASSSLR